MKWWKVTKSSPSSPFHPVCVVLSHMALMLATSLTKGKTTPRHSQPEQTAGPTAFSCLTHDPTVHHVPVIWILVLADRVEKRDKGRKEEEAKWKLACIEVFVMLQNSKSAAQVRCNGNSKWVQFHKRDLNKCSGSETSFGSSIFFHPVAELSTVLIPFDS